MLELVAAWSQERKPPAQCLYTALGWRYSSSPKRKRTNVETRVSLCQYQTPPFSFLSPTHTTSTPGGAFQTVLKVRLFQKKVLPARRSLSRTHSTESSS